MNQRQGELSYTISAHFQHPHGKVRTLRPSQDFQDPAVDKRVREAMLYVESFLLLRNATCMQNIGFRDLCKSVTYKLCVLGQVTQAF